MLRHKQQYLITINNNSQSINAAKLRIRNTYNKTIKKKKSLFLANVRIRVKNTKCLYKNVSRYDTKLIAKKIVYFVMVPLCIRKYKIW